MSNSSAYVKCRVCQAIGFILTAVAIGIITVWAAGALGVFASILLFLVLLAVGIWAVFKFCGNVPAEAEVHVETVAPAPTPTSDTAAVPAVELEGEGEGAKPATLDTPRYGNPDDLKKIKGVGPMVEQMLNGMGFYHYDQVAAWTVSEVAWVDANLKGFKGRVSRDSWVDQAKTLADGGDTAFSKKVDKGGVY